MIGCQTPNRVKGNLQHFLADRFTDRVATRAWIRATSKIELDTPLGDQGSVSAYAVSDTSAWSAT